MDVKSQGVLPIKLSITDNPTGQSPREEIAEPNPIIEPEKEQRVSPKHLEKTDSETKTGSENPTTVTTSTPLKLKYKQLNSPFPGKFSPRPD